MGRKYCGKSRKCWLPAISPFPTMFSNGCFCWVAKSQDFVLKSLAMLSVGILENSHLRKQCFDFWCDSKPFKFSCKKEKKNSS